MAHSEETKKRISEKVKATNQRKAEAKLVAVAAKEVDSKKKSAAENFSKGHPDGLAPSAVRNYGDFGSSVIVKVTAGETPAPEQNAKERRPEIQEAINRKCGESGGKTSPPAITENLGGQGVTVRKS